MSYFNGIRNEELIIWAESQDIDFEKHPELLTRISHDISFKTKNQTQLNDLILANGNGIIAASLPIDLLFAILSLLVTTLTPTLMLVGIFSITALLVGIYSAQKHHEKLKKENHILKKEWFNIQIKKLLYQELIKRQEKEIQQTIEQLEEKRDISPSLSRDNLFKHDTLPKKPGLTKTAIAGFAMSSVLFASFFWCASYIFSALQLVTLATALSNPIIIACALVGAAIIGCIYAYNFHTRKSKINIDKDNVEKQKNELLELEYHYKKNNKKIKELNKKFVGNEIKKINERLAVLENKNPGLATKDRKQSTEENEIQRLHSRIELLEKDRSNTSEKTAKQPFKAVTGKRFNRFFVANTPLLRHRHNSCPTGSKIRALSSRYIHLLSKTADVGNKFLPNHTPPQTSSTPLP